MQVLDKIADFDSKFYNELEQVEVSNREVNRDGRKFDYLVEAGSLIRKFNLHEKLGIGLLHRHHDCGENEIMIEGPGTVDGEAALITEPHAASEAPAAVPRMWGLADDRFLPIEYTTDRRAKSIYADCTLPSSFKRQFAVLNQRSPVGKYFGLAIVERDLFDDIDDITIPLEYSDQENRMSVILLRGKGIYQSIETAWTFKRDIDIRLGCDEQSWCTTSCRNECIIDYGKHSPVHFDHHNVVREHKYV